MQTITIKINERSKAGSALQKILEVLKNQPGVEIITETEKYNTDFVKKINEARKEKGGKIVTAENLWESIK